MLDFETDDSGRRRQYRTLPVFSACFIFNVKPSAFDRIESRGGDAAWGPPESADARRRRPRRNSPYESDVLCRCRRHAHIYTGCSPSSLSTNDPETTTTITSHTDAVAVIGMG